MYQALRVCWFGLQPRPWTGSVPTLLVDIPEDRGAAWAVTAGLARFEWDPQHRAVPALWRPVSATLADVVAWMLRDQIVPHRATRHASLVSGPKRSEWAKGWSGSWSHSWRLWWSAPAHAVLAREHARYAEEVEQRRWEAEERRAAQERLEAKRLAAQERERAKKREAKNRAYEAFWARTGMDRGLWRVFATMLTGFLGEELAFGMPDPRYGDGRPAYRCTDAGPVWTEPVAVACPDPGKLRAWAGHGDQRSSQYR